MGCGCGGRKGVKGKSSGSTGRKTVVSSGSPNTGWRVNLPDNVVYPPRDQPAFFSIAEARSYVRGEGRGTIVRA